MKYARDYSQAMKYGRLRNRDEYEPFLEEIEKHKAVDIRDSSDHRPGDPREEAFHSRILADFLQDENDPRADLIRGHLERVEKGGTPPQGGTFSRVKLPTESGGLLLVKPHPEGVQIGWYVHRSEPNKPGEMTQFHYHKMFAPEEAREFASRLPEGSGKELHTLLDLHYPQKS